jgi:hypothetical protein
MNKPLLIVCAVLALGAGAVYAWLNRSNPRADVAPLPEPVPAAATASEPVALVAGELPEEPAVEAPKSAQPPVVTIKPGLYPGEEEVMIFDPETGQFIQHGYRTFLGPDGVKKRIAFQRTGRPKTAARMNAPAFKKFGQDSGADGEEDEPETPQANAPFDYKLE